MLRIPCGGFFSPMIGAALLLAGAFVHGKSAAASPEQLLEQLTLDEKIAFFMGIGPTAYVGYVPGVDRLKIPPLIMNDGPQGFR